MSVMTSLHGQIRAAIEVRQQRARAATPGPWTASGLNMDPYVTADDGHVVAALVRAYSECAIALDKDDALFIAAENPAVVLRHCDEDLDVLERHPICTDPNCAGGDCHTCRREFYPCPEVLSLAHRYGIEAS
jgi:hypothetical protein